MKQFIRIKLVFIPIIAQFFITVFQASFFPYFSIYLQNNHFDPHVISLLLGTKALGEVLGVLIGGIYADNVKVARYTSGGFLLLAGAYTCLALAHSLGIYFITFGAVGFLYGFSYSCESNFMVLNRQHLSLERLYILINISMTLAKLFAPFIGAFGILSYAKCSIYLFVIFLVCYAGILFIASPVPTHDTTREPHDRGNRFSGYKPIFKNWNFILFVFFLLLITVCETSLYSSLPLYLKERFQETGVYIYTLTFSINEWIIASLFIFCRKAIEKLSSMDWIIASASLYSLIFLVLSKYGHLPKATLLLVICFSFAEITAKPIAYRLVIKLAEKGHSGKYQAVANLRFFLAGALSSFVGGLFIGKNNYYYGAFLFVSALSLPFAFIIRKSITRQLNK